MRTRLFSSGLLFPVLVALLAAQTAPVRPASSFSDTSYVTCSEKPGSSRMVVSDILISPDGKQRAYAEVEATALRGQPIAGYAGPLCVNNSRLYVGSSLGDFQLAFLQEPSDSDAGNSLRLVDWSADSRHLLMELAQWQYESPGVTRTPLVYDTAYRVFQQPDMNHIFQAYFGFECSLQLRVAGFSAEGKIVLQTGPLPPEAEEVLGLASCSKRKADWLLTIPAERLTPLPDGMKIVHYATLQRRPVK